MAAEETNIASDILLKDTDIDSFLLKYFSYYASLNAFWQKVFRERVLYFAKSKEFISGNNFVINNQVRAIVSASAVQLTLGLELWNLNYFDKIIVFPGDFLNKQTGLKLKGETNLGGFISLSWKSFLQGYKIKNDNLNLGIHEFTHALRFNGIRNFETDYFFSNYFSKWYCIGNKEFLNLSENKPSIFRAYGGSNINEFLSVVVEHFFESPEQFKSELPLLYSATAILLNQKQSDGMTRVNIRQQELNSHQVFCPLPEISTNVSFFKSTFAYIGLIFLLLGTFTFAEAGIFSFPTLCLLAFGVMNFMISDFKHTKALIQADRILISKGFFLFRNRKVFTVPFHHLILADFRSENSNDEAVMLTFFNNDDFFYEEEFHLRISPEQKQKLMTSLRKNYVWAKDLSVQI